MADDDDDELVEPEPPRGREDEECAEEEEDGIGGSEGEGAELNDALEEEEAILDAFER